ncbi:MAG TPA: bacillithiol biosynthesis BshC [Gemmatimonadaceae bacterium]|nr:bacillithiol biosynthesis BshC [Gemmatimonadaceae bacterium]
MSELRIVTHPLGGSPLARDAVAGRLPAAWLPAVPRGAAWRDRVAAVRDTFAQRDWLDALAPAISASGTAAARLARSAGGRGVVVTTGQQPGLFGGPLYTWHKALSALALADALERETGVPVAPLFWAATDDADFAEASVTYVAVPGGVREIALSGRAEASRRGSGAIALRELPLGDVRAQVAELVLGAGSATFADALETVRACYRADATVGEAYVCLLRALLEPMGIAVLDAGHPAVREAALPTLRKAMHAAREIDAALQTRDAEMRRAGYDPQVSHVPGLSLVFHAADGRQRLPIAQAVEGSAEPLGPNVLLRPVVERSILPTAAYVAGPAELAYFAQSSAVAAALDTAPPLGVPRWSATIVEPHVGRILDRHALRIEELRDAHAAETRLAGERVPDDVQCALAQLRQTAAEACDRMLAPDAARRLLPPAVIAGFHRDLEHRVSRLERRARAAVKRADAQMMHDIATARGSLFPGGAPQERRLNLIPLLARHGPVLLDALRAEASAHAAAVVESRAGEAPSAHAVTVASAHAASRASPGRG